MTREPSIIDVAPLTADRVEPFEGPRPYVATGAMTDSGIIDPEMVTFEERPSRADLQVRPGDVCIARMRSTEKCFVFGAGCEDLILSTGFAVFRPDRDQLDPAYLAHYLRTERFQQSKDRLCTGAVQPAITNTALGELTIPLPSVEEQKRIAAILDAADNLRTKRRQALTQLDTLTQAIFHDMFGAAGSPQSATSEQIAVRSGFPVRRLSEVAEFLDHLRQPITASDRVDGTTPYYGANGVQDHVEGWIFDEPLVLVAEDGGHFDDPERGVAYPIEGKAWVNNHAHVLRPTAIGQSYLAEYLRHKDLTKALTGSTRPKLNKSRAESLLVPVPPKNRQEDFERCTGSIDAALEVARKSAGQSDDLFASLQQRAFRGEL